MLIWLLLSVKFSVSSSTSLRNSLMSSSHLFIGLPIVLLVLYFELSLGFRSAAFINHLSLGDVAILSASLHFIFCESSSSIESSHFPSFLWDRLCFFLCSRSNLRLQSLWYQFLLQCRSRMTRRCPGLCECLSFCPSSLSSPVLRKTSVTFSSLISSFRFTIFLYLLFVCMMSRSILRCVDCIILSCSMVGVHVPDA